MKHLIIIISIIFITTNYAHAQYQFTWEKWGIKYEAPEKLDKYRTESKSVYGRDNDNYAVDIEVVSLQKESPEYISNIDSATYEIAKSMNIKNIKLGDSIPKIKKTFYVTGEDNDFDGSLNPVIILFVIDEKQGVAFEISIDCYNKNLNKGITIAKSFELIN